MAPKYHSLFETWHHKIRNRKNKYGENFRKMYWMSLLIANTSPYSPLSCLHGWAPQRSVELICEEFLYSASRFPVVFGLLMCFINLILPPLHIFYSHLSGLVIWWWWIVGEILQLFYLSPQVDLDGDWHAAVATGNFQMDSRVSPKKGQ